MNNPFSLFDKIYCINLDVRSDRLEQVLMEFERVGIKDRVERFPAIYLPYSAARGNHLSHAQCLRLAKESKSKNCLIFEDDVQFFNTNCLDILNQAIQELPKNWDMLYLGINMDIFWADQVSEHLAKLTGGYSTHAYAVSSSLFDKLIELNEDKNTIHNDVEYSYKIIPNYNCYVTIPLLAGQRQSYSNIQDKMMDSNQMFVERFEQRLRK